MKLRTIFQGHRRRNWLGKHNRHLLSDSFSQAHISLTSDTWMPSVSSHPLICSMIFTKGYADFEQHFYKDQTMMWESQGRKPQGKVQVRLQIRWSGSPWGRRVPPRPPRCPWWQSRRGTGWVPASLARRSQPKRSAGRCTEPGKYKVKPFLGSSRNGKFCFITRSVRGAFPIRSNIDNKKSRGPPGPDF